MKDYDVRPVDIDVAVGSLSGGNQQKMVVGRWLVSGGRVYLVDEPAGGGPHLTSRPVRRRSGKLKRGDPG